MRFGVGKDQPGVVIFLTLGTGVGSGLFNDGVLVPNTRVRPDGDPRRAAEKRSAAAARIRRGLSWKAWAADLDEHLDRIHQLIWPNLMILGGGVSKSADRFVPRLTVQTPVVPALLRNDAGIIGAAIIAAEAPIGRPAETPVYPIASRPTRRNRDRGCVHPATPSPREVIVSAPAADASTADTGAPS